ncbi:MAG TPA: hypothetical protein VH350_13850 [Candidatus Sulfotelmatobacter sp.]|nr:hypothetical protein [Candidatus Sulfotelmatobacter sp.]
MKTPDSYIDFDALDQEVKSLGLYALHRLNDSTPAEGRRLPKSNKPQGGH